MRMDDIMVGYLVVIVSAILVSSALVGLLLSGVL